VGETGLNPVEEFLPYFRPSIGEEEIKEVAETLRSGWITMGKRTIEFEKALAKYTGAKNIVSVNSCTDALELSLYVLGIKKGDEVITTTDTFAATANVIVHRGAKPVLVDIKKDTYNIDPELIERAITKKTKAIMPVDYAGQACEYDRIKEIAEKRDLLIVEDAAHAIGSEYKGKKLGTIGDTTCFSFYATKNMTSGEGGAVATEDDKVADEMRLMRLHGMSKNAWKRYAEGGSWYYEISGAGWNYVMTDIQAAIGMHQLKKLDRFIAERRKLAKIYNEEFGKVDGLITPYEMPDAFHSYYLYPLLVEKKRLDRNKLIEGLNKRGIGTSVHFIPIHLQPYYQKNFGYKKGDFPNAEWVYEREVSLPLFPGMREEDVMRVVKAVKEILANK
jgi:dTDP-4-amino-4,6-dideoxygalactose transaminase